MTGTLFPAEKGAVFSADALYRYRLWRSWGGHGAPSVIWCGLNPSTATETVDDPTIRKDAGFSRQWGFTRLEKINCFAFRSTDPHGLSDMADPVGPDNDAAIVEAVRGAARVVLCWGTHTFIRKLLKPRAEHVRRLILENATGEVGHLGLCADGNPRHTLMLPYSTPFQPI